MEKPSLHRAQFTETMCVAMNRKINTLESNNPFYTGDIQENFEVDLINFALDYAENKNNNL